MSSVSSISPVRLLDVASIEAVLARLDPASVDADIIPALAAVFPGFDFSLGLVDDHYRRDSRSVVRPDGTRVGELRPWMTAELAKKDGNIKALWSRLKKSDLQTTVWCGTSAYVFAPTGPGAGDYTQIALGRESEFRDGPIVNRESRPRRQEELLDPIWRGWDQPREEDRLVGPIYCLVNRRGGDVVHMGSFLERCGGYERDRGEAPRPKMEQWIVREAGADGMRESSLLETVSDLEWVRPRFG